MNVPKKVNYLLRKYNLFIQEYAKATPKWNELTLFDTFGGRSFTNSSPKGAPYQAADKRTTVLSELQNWKTRQMEV